MLQSINTHSEVTNYFFSQMLQVVRIRGVSRQWWTTRLKLNRLLTRRRAVWQAVYKHRFVPPSTGHSRSTMETNVGWRFSPIRIRQSPSPMLIVTRSSSQLCVGVSSKLVTTYVEERRHYGQYFDQLNHCTLMHYYILSAVMLMEFIDEQWTCRVVCQGLCCYWSCCGIADDRFFIL